MSWDSEETNTITWTVEKFVHFLAHPVSERWKQSPVFTMEYLDQTSWFIILDIVRGGLTPSLKVSLARDEKDKGDEIFELEWKFDFHLSQGIMAIEKEETLVKSFRKGTSSSWGVLTFEMGKVDLKEPLIIHCYMSHYLQVNRLYSPSTQTLDMRTRIGYYEIVLLFFQFLFVEKIVIPSVSGTLFEISFLHSGKTVDMRIRRIDQFSNAVCFMVFSSSVQDEDSGGDAMFRLGSGDERHLVFGKDHKNEHTFSVPLTRDLPMSRQDFRFTMNSVISSIEIKNVEKGLSDSEIRDGLRFDFLRMYSNKMHTDVIIQVENETLPAHKCVLSARSPVLSTIFSRDLIKNQTKVINITDMNAETVELMLKFMYSDALDELDCERSLKLLLAAEKYQVVGLKERCSAHLATVLSVTNACDILNAADMVGQQNLKFISMDYVVAHALEIFFLDSWKKLGDQNIKVVSETLRKMSDDFWNVVNEKCTCCE